jgi:hypothetical protein
MKKYPIVSTFQQVLEKESFAFSLSQFICITKSSAGNRDIVTFIEKSAWRLRYFRKNLVSTTDFSSIAIDRVIYSLCILKLEHRQLTLY